MKKPSLSGTHPPTVLTLLLLATAGATITLSLVACDDTSTKTADTTPAPTPAPTSTPDDAQVETPVTYPTPAATFPAQKGGSTADYYEASFGWTFTPTEDIEVTHLGYFDDSGDGLLIPHPVAIFDTATREVIVKATVEKDSPLEGTHRYVEVVPVTLTAGKTYIVVSHSEPPWDPEVKRPHDLTWAPETGNSDLGLKVDYYEAIGATELMYPRTQEPFLLVTPNFKFTPVAAK